MNIKKGKKNRMVDDTYSCFYGNNATLMASINTTPLVDVMLVLLIVFLVTLPLSLKSVTVALPTAQNSPTKNPVAILSTIVVAITKEKDIYWNDIKLDSHQPLLSQITSFMNNINIPANQLPEIRLRADADTPFALIGRLMWALQQAGLKKLTLITKPK